jgi:molecular chaperone DnaK (HSP70)
MGRKPPDHVAEIASHVLGFLAQGAGSEAAEDPAARVVVTVSASFQAAQRGDTLAACRLADSGVTFHVVQSP